MNKFWDLDDIIMTSEIVVVVTEKDLEGVEYFHKSLAIQNYSSEDSLIIKSQSNLEIPLCLAIPLRKKKEEIWLTINKPKYLSIKFYNFLQADPVIANLKSKSQYFYGICIILISLELTDLNNQDQMDIKEITTWKENWQKCLTMTISKRNLYFVQNSFNVQFENQSILKNVCLAEKNFYEKVLFNNKSLKFWKENYLNNNKSMDLDLDKKIISGKRRKLS